MLKRKLKYTPIDEWDAHGGEEAYARFCQGVITPRYRRPVPPPPVRRPCKVNGRDAFFHRWIEDDRALVNFNAFLPRSERERIVQEFKEQYALPQECSLEVLRETFALVEYVDDGTVSRVRPEMVVFTAK